MDRFLRRPFKTLSLLEKSNPQVEKYGLFPLNEISDTNPNCTIDIVAIHGLGGHYLNAWTDRRSDGTEICWLSEFIPLQFEDRVRILSFGYDSQTAFSNSVNTIEDTARTLLNSILNVRTEPHQIKRPIIFIAHSLGGIIFKKALVIANEHTSRFGSILEATQAAMLFAVPHRGSDLAFWGDLAASVLSLLNLANPRFVKALRSQSVQLQAISEQSVQRLEKLKAIITFHESNKTNGRLIVNKDSVALHVPNEILVQIPDSNHITICKFVNYESQKYRSIRSELQGIVKEIEKGGTNISEPSISSHRAMFTIDSGDLRKHDVEPYVDDIPSRRALHFVERTEIQSQLERHFTSLRDTPNRPIVTLIGMGEGW